MCLAQTLAMLPRSVYDGMTKSEVDFFMFSNDVDVLTMRNLEDATDENNSHGNSADEANVGLADLVWTKMLSFIIVFFPFLVAFAIFALDVMATRLAFGKWLVLVFVSSPVLVTLVEFLLSVRIRARIEDRARRVWKWSRGHHHNETQVL